MKHPLETRCGHGAPVGSKRARIEGHVVMAREGPLIRPSAKWGSVKCMEE